MGIRKDQVLDRLAEHGNVAQFISFEPTPKRLVPNFSRLAGRAPNDAPADAGAAISALLAASGEGSVNIRSYSPDDPRSREFVYGLIDPVEVLATVERLSVQGLHTIVNETVDVSDGGVSGVVQGHAIEFAPDDTPRCVEKPGTAAMAATAGLQILETVYGFRPDVLPAAGDRTEFSIHPRPRGWRRSHTLLWEREENAAEPAPPTARWPNLFSRMIGDKAFGLLVANEVGLHVPRSLVVGRRLAPFAFGQATGSHEVWTRTCPHEPQPGLYTTVKGWTDPFSLLAREDVDSRAIAAVLRQDAVPARHSGAAIVTAEGDLAIEGRQGEGDGFMLGTDLPEPLPFATLTRVRQAFERLVTQLGPVRCEWVDDGDRLWIVQLHVGATATSGRIVVAGEPERWLKFDARLGLSELRAKLATLTPEEGILVTGGVGLTSHVADVLRKFDQPARLVDS
jgi:hypothetical protein